MRALLFILVVLSSLQIAFSKETTCSKVQSIFGKIGPSPEKCDSAKELYLDMRKKFPDALAYCEEIERVVQTKHPFSPETKSKLVLLQSIFDNPKIKIPEFEKQNPDCQNELALPLNVRQAFKKAIQPFMLAYKLQKH